MHYLHIKNWKNKLGRNRCEGKIRWVPTKWPKHPKTYIWFTIKRKKKLEIVNTSPEASSTRLQNPIKTLERPNPHFIYLVSEQKVYQSLHFQLPAMHRLSRRSIAVLRTTGAARRTAPAPITPASPFNDSVYPQKP